METILIKIKTDNNHSFYPTGMCSQWASTDECFDHKLRIVIGIQYQKRNTKALQVSMMS